MRQRSQCRRKGRRWSVHRPRTPRCGAQEPITACTDVHSSVDPRARGRPGTEAVATSYVTSSSRARPSPSDGHILTLPVHGHHLPPSPSSRPSPAHTASVRPTARSSAKKTSFLCCTTFSPPSMPAKTIFLCRHAQAEHVSGRCPRQMLLARGADARLC